MREPRILTIATERPSWFTRLSHIFRVPARPQVDKILDELGLTKCANTRIGHSGAGISGGERKRLSFATEMLIDPSVLIVDEPTSGLDSAMAESVVEKLKTLATGSGSKKRTVVMTIHQPSAELFKLIDKLLIIVDGKVGYFGPAKAAVGYFSDTLGDLGTCPENSNPPDFFMRLVSTIATMLSVSCSHFFLKHSRNSYERIHQLTKSMSHH